MMVDEMANGNNGNYLKAEEKISMIFLPYGTACILASLLFLCILQPTHGFLSYRIGWQSSLRLSLGRGPAEHCAAFSSTDPHACRCRARHFMSMSGETSSDDAYSLKLSSEILQDSLRSRGLASVDLNNQRHLRVFAISDLHSDYRQSLNWIEAWNSYKDEYSHTVLLVGGDLSGDIRIVQSTLEACKEKFDEVFFVAGNHDLWVQPHFSQPDNSVIGSNGHRRNSLHKLSDLVDLCDILDVRVGPVCFSGIAGGPQKDVWVFPLLSWYHASWDKEPNLPEEVTEMIYSGRPGFEKRWADFRNCKWPEIICSKEDFVSTTSDSTALAEYFACLNKPWIRRFEARKESLAADLDPSAPYSDLQNKGNQEFVISFSHFLPRIELCPEKRFLIEPEITKVIGSDPLERQVRSIQSDLHVFGHTHIPIDMELEGVRYLTWPLGSAREQNRQCRPVKEVGPLLIYDSTQGGEQPIQETMWGTYYQENDRDVLVTEIAPWVLNAAAQRQRR
mmetsp:Transcript_8977/g.11904  ORF Transcript_8977/g.11904 Transcript_8977/m.11904 type:complete len:505 (-) Transcript_8977:298-1812(-)